MFWSNYTKTWPIHFIYSWLIYLILKQNLLIKRHLLWLFTLISLFTPALPDKFIGTNYTIYRLLSLRRNLVSNVICLCNIFIKLKCIPIRMIMFLRRRWLILIPDLIPSFPLRTERFPAQTILFPEQLILTLKYITFGNWRFTCKISMWFYEHFFIRFINLGFFKF